MDDKVYILLEKFNKSNLSSLKYKDSNFELELEKKINSINSTSSENKLDNFVEEIDSEEKYIKEDENIKEIKSPIVGIFYSRLKPDSDILVNVGDRVKKGDILCIVEAMKMFNEIRSPYDGKIIATKFKDEDLVEYDDILFEVKVDD